MQGGESLHELLIGSGSKTADTDIAHSGANQIGCIEGFDGDFVARNDEGEHTADTSSQDAELHFRSLWSAQTAHHLVARHLHTGKSRVVHHHNAVARLHAHFLGGAVTDGLNHEKRVLHDVELHADALERAL